MIKHKSVIPIKLDHLPRFMANNRVLVRIDFFPDEVKGGLIKGNADWSESAHVVRYGTVVKAPIKLWNRKRHKFGMDWEFPYDTKTLLFGDIAYFGLMESFSCPVVEIGNDRYYVVNFHEIVAVKRGESLRPLNGYVLVEEYVETAKSKIIIVDFSKKQNKKRGIVKHVGLPNICYRHDEAQDARDINVGDIVNFRMNLWTELEDERYQTLGKGLGYVQRRWINFAV